MLVLRCPASEQTALHSLPHNTSPVCLHASIVYVLVSYAGASTPSEPQDSNSRFNSPALIDFGGGQGRNIPHASHETCCLILETAKVCTRNQKDGSSSSSHAKRTAQHYRSVMTLRAWRKRTCRCPQEFFSSGRCAMYVWIAHRKAITVWLCRMQLKAFYKVFASLSGRCTSSSGIGIHRSCSPR